MFRLISDSNKSVNKTVISFFIIIIFVFTHTEAQENYFYTNKPYGSEALFNPVSLIFNGGYDVFQLQSISDRIGDHEYNKMIKVVFRNLGDPFGNIKEYGVWHFIRGEILPLSWEKGNMQWIPNYQQHLIGGGMLYTSMKEWYKEHNFPEPWLFSFVTIMTQHLVNEVLESGPNEGYSVDEVSDIYIFDLGGIVLFSFDSVNEFFSKKLNLADWSLQATVTMPNGKINAGQYFSMKWKPPFSEEYSLFYRYGMGALFGVSKKLNFEDNLSLGLGFKTKHLVDLNSNYRQRTIETGWHAGVFYDRNNSLLASLVFSGVKEYFCMADVYPGIIKIGDFSPGVWGVFGRDGNMTLGFTTRYIFSIGYEMNY
jgi:hypothetical protein